VCLTLPSMFRKGRAPLRWEAEPDAETYALAVDSGRADEAQEQVLPARAPSCPSASCGLFVTMAWSANPLMPV
jgi:hypothetical protein